MTIQSASTPLVLSGLDGTNPLGFLAALGTLVTLHEGVNVKPRLGWKRSLTWTPILECPGIHNPEALSNTLADALRGISVSSDAEARREATLLEFDLAKKAVKDKRNEIKRRKLRGSDWKTAFDIEVAPLEEKLRQKRQSWLMALKEAVPRPELAIGKHIDCTVDEYRDQANNFIALSNHTHRETIDLLAAFGSDACIDERLRHITGTPFCFITGSGHQYFLDTVRQLMEVVNRERIYATLFEPWTYGDEKLSMRWDPLEDRRYALMDRDPTTSDNKSRTVWMANLLAYRALVLFPSASRGKHLNTTAWNHLGDIHAFTWPFWEQPADLDSIRSILQLPELTAANPDTSILRARGIVAAFRARRIQVGNPPLHKINFSTAGGIL